MKIGVNKPFINVRNLKRKVSKTLKEVKKCLVSQSITLETVVIRLVLPHDVEEHSGANHFPAIPCESLKALHFNFHSFKPL